MKLPFFRQNKPEHALQKPRRALDAVASKAPTHVGESLRRTQTSLSSPSSVFASRNLDSVRGGERGFIIQLKKCKLQDVSWRLFRKTELYFRFAKRTVIRLTPSIAPHKMLYGSLIGGVAFGIISMGFIEHFFGPGVFARSQDPGQDAAVSATGAVIAAALRTPDLEQPYSSDTDVFAEYFNEVPDAQYKESIQNMVKDYPIAAMLPYILEQDRLTSAFLIGIAKKESNWGKRVPVLDGQDCFNYWGYRGVRRLMGTGGHTCFNSTKDAVETVAKRLNTLIYSEALNTPEKMVVWKCGFSCSGQSRESVKKWISDVDMYFSQLSDE